MRRTVLGRAAAVVIASVAIVLALAAPASANLYGTQPDPAGDSSGPPGTDLRQVTLFNQTQIGTVFAETTFDTRPGPAAGDAELRIMLGNDVGQGCDMNIGDGLLIIQPLASGPGTWQAFRDGKTTIPARRPTFTARQGSVIKDRVLDSRLASRNFTCAVFTTGTPDNATIYDRNDLQLAPPLPARPVETLPDAPTPENPSPDLPPPFGPQQPTQFEIPDEFASNLAIQIAGNRAAEENCQRLVSDVPGAVRAGRNRVRLVATGQPADPVAIRITGPRPRSARWTLDGRGIEGTRRGLELEAVELASSSNHRVGVTLVGRNGRRSSASVAFRTAACGAGLTATANRRSGGSELDLRVDSAEALSEVTFSVPKSVRDAATSYTAVLRSAGEEPLRSYEYGVDRLPLVPTGAPALKASGDGLTLSGLPLLTGIVSLQIESSDGPLRAGTAFTASVVANGADKRLSARVGR